MRERESLCTGRAQKQLMVYDLQLPVDAMWNRLKMANGLFQVTGPNGTILFLDEGRT